MLSQHGALDQIAGPLRRSAGEVLESELDVEERDRGYRRVPAILCGGRAGGLCLDVLLETACREAWTRQQQWLGLGQVDLPKHRVEDSLEESLQRLVVVAGPAPFLGQAHLYSLPQDGLIISDETNICQPFLHDHCP